MATTKVRLYLNSKGMFSARPTKCDATGITAYMYNEQYRRDLGNDNPPEGWGLKNAKTGNLARVTGSRTKARQMRRDNERVVAIWLG